MPQLSTEAQEAFNRAFPSAAKFKLGDRLKEALGLSASVPLPSHLSLFVPGNLGHDAGPATDGVILGTLTARAMTKFLMSGRAQAVVAIADDGGAYTVETTGANDATANNMTLLPAAAAVDDAYYLSHATKMFDTIELVIGTKGDFVGTIAVEYWDTAAEAWTACEDLVDGTAAFTADPGTVLITHTPAETWGKCLVDGSLGYWLRIRVATATSGGGALGTRAWAYAVAGQETFADDTTDINSVGAGDVDLLPVHAVVGDAAYFGGGTTNFCKMVLTVSTAITGTNTRVWELWDGNSWEAAPSIFEDNSAAFATAPGAHVISFRPPDWWVANTAGNGPNGQAGFFIRCRLATMTDYTAQPKASRCWVQGFAGSGFTVNRNCTVRAIQAIAGTISAANGDSDFILVNLTTGAFTNFHWTKATRVIKDTAVNLAVSAGDQLVLVQLAEDGATEFANVNFILDLAAA